MTNQKRLKLILILTCIVFISFSRLEAQVNSSDTLFPTNAKINQFSIDWFLLPMVVYNSMTFGVNYQRTTKFEHSLKFDASVFRVATRPISFSINYNFNLYAKNRKNYLPIWIGLKNTLKNVGYEEGYFPNTLRPSIGLGYGRKAQIFKKLTTRIECIAGASLNLTNRNNDLYAFNKFSDYSFDDSYPQYNPKIIPTVRIKMTFVKKF